MKLEVMRGGGLNREGGLINFPPRKGGLNRGFTVYRFRG